MEDGLKKTLWPRKKHSDRGNFDDHLFEETMGQYEARTADRCEEGKGCCALRILEAESDFKNEISLLEP